MSDDFVSSIFVSYSPTFVLNRGERIASNLVAYLVCAAFGFAESNHM